MRVYNFSAGPSMLPVEVLEEIQKDLLNYNGTGMSVTEMSHRSKPFMAINEEANALLRELMCVPENYDILFHTTGFNGYKNGTISLWVKVSVTPTQEQPTENDYKIDKVILADYNKQTLMSKFAAEFYNNFTKDLTEDFIKGKVFTSNKDNVEDIQNIVTGATKSATAACNAVNCVLEYVWGAK